VQYVASGPCALCLRARTGTEQGRALQFWLCVLILFIFYLLFVGLAHSACMRSVTGMYALERESIRLLQ